MKALSTFTLTLFFILSAAARPQVTNFERVSIQRNVSGTSGPRMGRSPGAFNSTNTSLQQLILSAYKIKDIQLTGGPSWIYTDRFDVSAESSGQAIGEELTMMTQAMLTSEFHLKLRREAREMDVYALTIGKDGSKLRQVPPKAKHGTNSSPGYLSGQSVSLQDIAIALSSQLDRPVKDFTGLQGSFSFEMSYAFDPLSFVGILKAAEEQLGLRLEATRAPVDVFVIDGAEIPRGL